MKSVADSSQRRYCYPLHGRYTEPLHLLTLRQLRTLSDDYFILPDYAPRITRRPGRYYLILPTWVGGLLGMLPLWL